MLHIEFFPYFHKIYKFSPLFLQNVQIFPLLSFNLRVLPNLRFLPNLGFLLDHDAF